MTIEAGCGPADAGELASETIERRHPAAAEIADQDGIAELTEVARVHTTPQGALNHPPVAAADVLPDG